MNQPKVLLVEDEQVASMDIRSMIEEAGYRVEASANTAESALTELETSSPNIDLVIMDITLPGELDGIEATRKINETYEDLPVVYLTAYSDDETVSRARATQPAGFLIKPVTKADIKATVEMALGSKAN